MLNIAIRDLKVRQELDERAMAVIFGGADSCTNYDKIVSTMQGRAECLGSFIEGSQIVNKYKCYYYEVHEKCCEKQIPICLPTCVNPCTPC